MLKSDNNQVSSPETDNVTNTQQKRVKAKWRALLTTIQKAFPSPWKEEGDDRVFENTFLSAVAQLNTMKHPRTYKEQKAWQGYLGDRAVCKRVR